MPTDRTVSSRHAVVLAATLIVAQLAVRSWLVGTGNFYWDDLILIGRSATESIGSWAYFGHSHDGHFMPAAFLVAGLSTLLAPLNWAVPAVTLVALQALASVAVWRMIRVIVPPGHGVTRDFAAVAALAFYLFSPMTLPAFIWWAAGLNSLPLQAALAWIVADAVILTRGVAPGRVRGVVIRSSVIFVVALAFFEKSLFILPVAFVAAVLVARWLPATPGRGDPDPDLPTDPPLATAFVNGRRLWASLGVIFVVWGLLFLAVSDAASGAHSLRQTVALVWRSINNGVIPSLVGGPWHWERWVPSPPMGFAPIAMIVAGWLVAIGVGALAWRWRVGGGAVVVCAAAYVVLAQLPVMWNRSSVHTAVELAQTLRYLPDSALVLTLAAALLIASPPRPAPARSSGLRNPVAVRVSACALVIVAVVSTMISTIGYRASWVDDPTANYLANAKRALAANRDHTMLDQEVPPTILLPVTYPYNRISDVFGRLPDRSPFGDVTDALYLLDADGNLAPGAVAARRTIPAGRGTCARPELGSATQLRLDGPLLQWQWTLALAYCANMAGTAQVWLDGGSPVRVSFEAGLHVVYVRLGGGAQTLHVVPLTPGLAVHTGQSQIGEVVDARLLSR